MNLKTIFKKPVDRPIDGVIKADDQTSLQIEVEEYVLTNEIEKQLEHFLSEYNNYNNANGVWISGFFGSGKSHMLKIMSLLLEDKKINGSSVMDIILSKCGDNEILRGDLKKAISIPSKSILFNIDQKAAVISKTQTDALLAVFVKVFDETCGYFGQQPYIAQFERELDHDGLFDKFKASFEELATDNWDFGRMRPMRVSSFIDQAYNKITGQNVVNILDKYRSDYKLSIEDFAIQVSDYIDRQDKNFRLNFFVDEVGQYIADNIKLMTNLQTIAESLATKCKGRAWVIVTAQEDMDTIVGDMNKKQFNDFTKIMARFNIRMKLTSADVAEVIQKRLLMKNDTGERYLSDIYDIQVNNMKTLFDFADGSQTYRNFRDIEHFTYSYPFIPYQFTLFQVAIQNLSQHNVFEGRHRSIGERSMLAVFQGVVLHIGTNDIGSLATFDLMFEGIRSALKANSQRAILNAEKNLHNKFAVSLLKALFLVKYVKEFKATIRNLRILMQKDFDLDSTKLKNNVEEALNLLEQETYIQRNGELYEYLTNEEKDVEQEIKNTDVEISDVSDELGKILYDQVLGNKKIRFKENGQDYSFSKKLDDRLQGREHELSINIISPFNENIGKENTLKTQNMLRDELLIIMPPDDRITRDILMYKRTEKYIKLNISLTQQDAIRKILSDKSFQNRERLNELRQDITSIMRKAKIIVGGTEIQQGGEDPQGRIVRGFYELIQRTYPNLKMLRGITYTEGDIKNILENSQESLFGDDDSQITEPEQEMMSFILGNNRSGVRTTMKTLIERFELKPYGWYYAVILCILAKLFVRGKIVVKTDGNIIDDKDIESSLRNTHYQGNLIIDPQIEIPVTQVKKFKEFYEDFFDAPINDSDVKTIGKSTNDAFKEMIHQLEIISSRSSIYPFNGELINTLEALRTKTGKPNTWYLSDLLKQEDELMDMKENIIDPVKRFMNSPFKEIYDTALNFIREQEHNFSYIKDDDIDKIQQVLNDPVCYKGNNIQQLKTMVDSLRLKAREKVETAISDAVKTIKGLKTKFQEMEQFSNLTEEHQKGLLGSFDNIERTIARQSLIPMIRESVRVFEENDYMKLLSRMDELVKPITQPDGNPPTETPIKYVSRNSINITFNKPWIADETDVDQYLSSMREAFLKKINEGNRIKL